jgi:glycosyltransferase involved in cell wall biosynthesis
MKICFVSPYSPKVVGGIGTFISEMNKNLREKRIDSVILSRSYDNDFYSDDRVFEIPATGLRYVRSIIFAMRLMLFIIRNYRNIDVLHLQSTNHIIAPVAVMGRILGIPTLTTVHGKIPHGKRFPLKQASIFGEFIILNFSDQINYVSADTQNHYDKEGDIIPNGVDKDKFHFDKRRREEMRSKFHVEGSFVFLYVGRLTSTKGIYDLLEALAKLKTTSSADFRLVIVGLTKDQNIEDYLEAVRKFDLEHNIIIIPQQQDIAGFYNMSDAFILPTHTEGMPFALLEAMSSEMLVMASDVGDIGKLIVQEENGFLVKPKNVDEILTKLEWCINNQDEGKVLGRNARNTVIRNYNVEQMIDSYINLYKDLVTFKNN